MHYLFRKFVIFQTHIGCPVWVLFSIRHRYAIVCIFILLYQQKRYLYNVKYHPVIPHQVGIATQVVLCGFVLNGSKNVYG